MVESLPIIGINMKTRTADSHPRALAEENGVAKPLQCLYRQTGPITGKSVAVCKFTADTNMGMKVIPSQSISIVQAQMPVNRHGGPHNANLQ